MHAVYMLTVNEPSITIAFFALLAGAAYLVSQQVGRVYTQLAIIFARVSLILVNFGFWIGSLWGDYPGETWVQGQDYRLWSNREAWRAALASRNGMVPASFHISPSRTINCVPFRHAAGDRAAGNSE